MNASPAFYAAGGRAYALCRMTTRSMEPVIAEGELVLVEKLGGRPPAPGDLLLMPPLPETGLSFVHRLVAAVEDGGRRLLVTKGDGRAYLDPPELWAPEPAVLGRVVMVRRRGVWLSVEGLPARLAARAAAALFAALHPRGAGERLPRLNAAVGRLLAATLAARPFAWPAGLEAP
ncbi:MAG: S24/S26 family peptidase [Elusimicrobiota bacterium]|nr:S24/S26 family peptidase [Elusimicrobiota bacterium]